MTPAITCRLCGPLSRFLRLLSHGLLRFLRSLPRCFLHLCRSLPHRFLRCFPRRLCRLGTFRGLAL